MTQQSIRTWKIVPVEQTEEMLKAAHAAAYMTRNMRWRKAEQIRWAAQLREAPQHQTAEAFEPVATEQLTRYCPGCGSVGTVPAEYQDCCPDGSEARLIPQALAEKCRDTLKLAIGKAMANAAANDPGTPLVPVAGDVVAPAAPQDERAVDSALRAAITLLDMDLDHGHAAALRTMLAALPAQAVALAPQDKFDGDDSKLVSSINALLALDATDSLVPHGVGGHARVMLAAAASRLATVADKPVYQVRGNQFGQGRPWSWLDASEDAYGYTLPENRRILYTRPAPVQAVAPTDAQDIPALLKNANVVHANMCRGIIAPITFDMLAHVLGDDAKRQWWAEHAAPQASVQLDHVIAWLEGGCDPLHAAQELRALVPQAAPTAPQAVPAEWISEMIGGWMDDLTAGQAYRQGWNDCRAAALKLAAQPVAQPADVQQAVTYVIRRAQRDARLASLIGPGTQCWDVLTESAALAAGREVDEYRAAIEKTLRYERWPGAGDIEDRINEAVEAARIEWEASRG